MKRVTLLFFSLACILACAQKEFILILPDVQKIKTVTANSEGLPDEIQIYLNMHYGENPKKTAVKTEADGTTECGATSVFDRGITYTVEQCNESAIQYQKVVLPKTDIHTLQKWVEHIYASGITDIPNAWYSDTRYGPTDKEAGCYYTITQSDTQSSIAIECGC